MMNIFVDTIKYKIDINTNTREFINYLKDNGIMLFENPKNYKKPIYIVKSNECSQFIKGSANSFTLFKSNKINNVLFLEFYGLKSYCECIDNERNNIIRLFQEWIIKNDFIKNTSIYSVDIACDFEKVHPIEIELKKVKIRGNQPLVANKPDDKNFYLDNTYYLYDNEYLKFFIKNDYTKDDLESVYNDMFGDDVYFMDYDEEIEHCNFLHTSLIKNRDSSLFGVKIKGKFIHNSRLKGIRDKLLKQEKNNNKDSSKLYSNNKNIFFNSKGYKKQNLYVKKEINSKTNITKKYLFVKNSEYQQTTDLYYFIQELKVKEIIESFRIKKDFQVIVYDKKNKVNSKYKLNEKITGELSRVEFKINKIEDMNKDIVKKINSIEIFVNNEKKDILEAEVLDILKPYKI